MTSIANAKIYKIVETSLDNKEKYNLFKSNIDNHMARNISIYTANGPGKRPIFTTNEAETLYGSLGLTVDVLKDTLQELKKVESRWGIRGVNYPVMLAACEALRYFTLKNDESQIKNSLSYMICFQYSLLHYKYFRYEPTESIMNYTISNMSNKYRIKTIGNLWGALIELVEKCYELHKSGIKKGDDQSLVKFCTDVRTRINSFMKKIRGEFEKVYRSGEYLQSEKESFEEDKYYEADSNTLAIERMTNKILMKLVVNGPNLKLAEIAATHNHVSINQLRTYVQTMITDKQREDIRTIIQCLLTLYTFSSEENHTMQQVGTNDFLIYCMKVYKKSNTVDKNVLMIKKILDKWLDDLGLMETSSRSATINDFRRALYMFFVLSIEANA